METEAIYGEPLRAAASKGIRLPCIETLYHALSFLNCQEKRHLK